MLERLRRRIAQVQPAAGPVLTVAVWPENWHAAQLFVAMSTQWRVTEMGNGQLRYWGLRYEALPPVLDELAGLPHVQPHHVLMRQVRYLEQRALHHVNPKT